MARAGETPHTSFRNRPAAFRSRPVAALGAVLILAALLPVSGSAQQGRTVIGSEGIDSRNDPVRIAAGALVQGPTRGRNGSVTIGARSEVQSVSSRNGPISIGAHTTVLGPVDNRNGAIELAEGVSVAGFVESRNGGIDLSDDVRVEGAVATRNGAVRLGARGHVGGDIETRNGNIHLGNGAWVDGSVTSRNGAVRLDGARVVRNVDVHTGDLELLGATRVDGDVIVLLPESRGSAWFSFFRSDSPREPVVRIGPDVQIGGRLIIDERARLHIDGSAGVPEPEFRPNR